MQNLRFSENLRFYFFTCDSPPSTKVSTPDACRLRSEAKKQARVHHVNWFALAFVQRGLPTGISTLMPIVSVWRFSLLVSMLVWM